MLVEDLNVILKVAEFRSITAAATHLNMQVATASAAVKRVEQQLGVELFVRSTRRLRLSVAGEKYIPQCEQALAMLQQASQSMKGEQNLIDGQLRISLSSDLGRNLVLPWLDDFLEKHQGLSAKVHISDSTVDFYRDPVDLALRYGSPTDANVYGFKLCDVPRVLCATPEYLATHGVPKHPQELMEHQGLFYQVYDRVHQVWEFSHQGDSYKIKMSGRRVSNDADLVRRWCIKGYGLAVKSCLDMSPHLLDGTLVPVLPEFQPTPSELWLICPSRQLITPAVRLLRDELKAQCRGVLQALTEKGVIN